jgi:hypothetical protein
MRRFTFLGSSSTPSCPGKPTNSNSAYSFKLTKTISGAVSDLELKATAMLSNVPSRNTLSQLSVQLLLRLGWKVNS